MTLKISEAYYTLNEVAALYEVNRLTIRRWMADGKLDGQRAGGGVFFARAYIDTKIAEVNGKGFMG